ncbi:MAG: hypothetical protein LDL33_09940 [Desulfomonile sp.]|nr:hypothetical protein [Desulfomonile sp.]
MNWLDLTKTSIIDPSTVDLEDATCFIPCWSPLGPLLRSIQAVGILNPPLVQARHDGTFIPVLGRRRLTAARHLGLAETSARIAPPEMPPTYGFELAFRDNVAHRTLDPASTAVVVRRLLELFPRQEVADRFLPALGMRPEGPRLERLRKIGGLEPPVLEALGTGRLLERTAALLTQRLPSERLALLNFAERLKLNANRAAEVISNVIDLAVFALVGVGDILSDSQLALIVEDENRSAPEKAAAVRVRLRRWKLPELTRREQEFHERLGKHGVPGKITVRPTANFEDERCSIEINAESWDETEEVLRLLHRIGEDRE